MGDGGSRSWRPHLSHQGPSGFLIERRSAPPNAAAPMRLGRSAAGLETSRGDRLPRRGRQHGPSWTYASQPQTPPEVPMQQHHHRRATVTPTRLREECWRLLLSGRSARLKAGVALEAGVICIRLRFVFSNSCAKSTRPSVTTQPKAGSTSLYDKLCLSLCIIIG